MKFSVCIDAVFAGDFACGVPAAKRYIGTNRASEGFDALARVNRLDLSLEALAISAKFNALFTDEEVNACFALLCGADYYRMG